MDKIKNFNSYDYLIFVVIFILFIPIGYLSGFISIDTVTLWGRYLCFAIVAMGLDMLWGYTGILCMSQAFFFCLGGYGIAMNMLLSASGKGVYGTAIPDFMVWNQVEELPLFWEPFQSLPLTLILCLSIPALFATIFGFFVFRSRLRGVYFAIITQALALATWLLFLRNDTMLGGTNGLTDFKTLGGFDLKNDTTKFGLYLTSCLALAGIYWGCRALIRSKFGKVLIAIRDSESRVRFTSYKVQDYKLTVFVLAAVIAAVGGMLYVPQTGIITPGRMDVKASIEMVVWVALGGRGKLKGAILGAILVNFLYSVFTSVMPGSWLYILGMLFIVTVLYLDEGIIGLPKKVRLALSRKRF